MKTSLLLLAFLLGLFTEYAIRYNKIHQPKVDLPEEYMAMTNDTIIGNYDSTTKTLYIRFK